MLGMIITARAAKKYLKYKQHYNLHLARKYGGKSVDIIISLPQSLQFSSSYVFGKLFASRNRQFLRTNIPAHFRAKWWLLVSFY